MPKLMIKCPATEQPIYTGMNLDETTFRGSELTDNIVAKCSACGGTHRWQKSDVIPQTWEPGQKTSSP
jgi:hypothetical protein